MMMPQTAGDTVLISLISFSHIKKPFL